MSGYYVRAGNVGRRGYRYIGPFATEWEAIAHRILMFSHETPTTLGIEQISADEIKANNEEGENKFVRPDVRQIDAYWKNNGLDSSRAFAVEEAKRLCGIA